VRSWLLVLVVGCGRIAFDPVDDDHVESGTRLHVQWDVYDDGLRIPISIFDTQLATRCVPSDVEGQTLCVPSTSSATSYSDAACTRPAIVSDCSIGPYLTTADGGLYHTGPDLGATMAYARVGTNCVSFVVTSPQHVYELGAEVLLDELATITYEPSAPTRLQHLVATSADGLRFPTVTAYDTELETVCIPTPGSQISCDPYPRATADYAIDAACTQHIAVHPTTLAETPTYAAVFDYASCPGDYEWFRISSEIAEPSPLYYDFGPGNGCQGATTGNQRFFSLGPRIDLATLESVQSTRPGRFQPLYNVGSGVKIRQARVFDAVTGELCGPLEVVDGTRRCVPTITGINENMFTDAACTSPIPIAVTSTRIGCARPAPPRYATRTVDVSCSLRLELREITGEHTAPLYTGSASNCMPATDSSSAAYQYYDVGALADLSMVPVVQTIIE
jgi:hypothetical protein